MAADQDLEVILNEMGMHWRISKQRRNIFWHNFEKITLAAVL
jgi:hypothetical protein